jgi:hypothetical protein
MLQLCLSTVSGGFAIDGLPKLNSEIREQLLILLALHHQFEVSLCVFILKPSEINQ